MDLEIDLNLHDTLCIGDGKLASEVEEHQEAKTLQFIIMQFKNHSTRIKGKLGFEEPKLRSNYQEAASVYQSMVYCNQNKQIDKFTPQKILLDTSLEGLNLVISNSGFLEIFLYTDGSKIWILLNSILTYTIIKCLHNDLFYALNHQEALNQQQ